MRMRIVYVTIIMETARSAYLMRMRRQPCSTAVYQGVVYLLDYLARTRGGWSQLNRGMCVHREKKKIYGNLQRKAAILAKTRRLQMIVILYTSSK